MGDIKTGVRAVMQQLAAQREAPTAEKRSSGWRCHANGCPMPMSSDSGMCRYHHGAGADNFQSVTTDLRRLEWVWQLRAELSEIENFKSWRAIAKRYADKHDIDMAPTDKDHSRELYLYRLHSYVDYRMRLVETKPKAIVRHCDQPEFKKHHHHERTVDEQHRSAPD